MGHTRWKQDFFNSVDPITLTDPLAETLGAVDDATPIHYHFTDCVKLAGHACASVASAFMMTKHGLKALYGDDTPVRGEISVRLSGGRTEGATGPIGQVISFLTGAAVETGFHGLAGRFARSGLFTYDENMEFSDYAISAEFTRTDTGAKVLVHANPALVPLSDEEMRNSALAPKVVTGSATPEERELFYVYWQGKNRKLLLDDNEGVFVVESLN